ncbi:hypothetical protein Sar04_35050 [Salinispora arenicola]|uniref:Uncharacterized protein n=1 Tax=Salinispora arenicola TaxID=168697 RepID=A0A542XSZ1_SALAC|nr:hypothetical protein FB564_4175 [Salinispora arenicola]GIM86769.1 hypothetical protein Sar04_35050 [Salinispora arenicola]
MRQLTAMAAFSYQVNIEARSLPLCLRALNQVRERHFELALSHAAGRPAGVPGHSTPFYMCLKCQLSMCQWSDQPGMSRTSVPLRAAVAGTTGDPGSQRALQGTARVRFLTYPEKVVPGHGLS